MEEKFPKFVRTEILRWLIGAIFNFVIIVSAAMLAPSMRGYLPPRCVSGDEEINFDCVGRAIGGWVLLHRTDALKAVFASFILALVFAFLYRALGHMVKAAKRGLQRREAVRKVGVSGYWSDWSASDGGGPWSEITKSIERAKNPVIYIWCAAGAATFGRESAPLYSLIEKFDGDIRFLLLDPDCNALQARAADIGKDVAQYREEISASLECIDKWRKKFPDIKVRLYHDRPNWKLILTADTAWVQYFRQHRNVQQTPIYQFFPNESRSSMFHIFHQEFLRIWDTAREIAPGTVKQVGSLDIFDAKNGRKHPFVYRDGRILWPSSWSQNDADLWRRTKGLSRPDVQA